MDPTSPVHTETVLPDEANRHVAREVTKVAGWVSTVLLIIIVCMISAIAFSTYALIELSNKVDSNARIASLASCADVNENRKELLDFIDSSLQRSEKATNALIASPGATPMQKRIAASNLVGLKLIVEAANSHLHPQRCVYPPVTKGS